MQDSDRSTGRLALWGGVECTKNRVGDRYFDQLDRSGHEERPSDLEAFAALGIEALRHPVLWSRVSPERPDEQDWRAADASLSELRALGIAPIVGLTWDLLCGRFTPDHGLWRHFAAHGVPEAELRWFAEHPCPPDVVGINYYVTSERRLDHRVERYASAGHGSGARYVDVEAVRARASGLVGPEALLMQAWARYRLPIAVTEVHLGCTREEQLRWLASVWNAAQAARDRGADVRAVTVWALLGSYGWCHLVCDDCGHYETGAFDLRAPQPRPTALAALARQLGHGEAPDHPVLQAPGWWERPMRLLVATDDAPASPPTPKQTPRPLLITGATGTLGRAFARLCELRGLPYRALTRQQMDLADPASIAATLAEADAWGVVNAAGFVRVDDAEKEAAACARDNTQAAADLAAACAARCVRLVTFSSDMVFAGSKPTPYVESDAPGPRNAYGRSKLAAERAPALRRARQRARVDLAVARGGARALVRRARHTGLPRLSSIRVGLVDLGLVRRRE